MHISWSFCACSVGLDSSNSSPTTVAWHPHQKSVIVIGKAFHPSVKYHRHCIGSLCGVLIDCCHPASGDELGRVTVTDFLESEPVNVETIHARRVNQLAFSTHRWPSAPGWIFSPHPMRCCTIETLFLCLPSAPMLASVSDDCSLVVLNSELREV